MGAGTWEAGDRTTGLQNTRQSLQGAKNAAKDSTKCPFACQRPG